jgi:uncharacterized phage protein gp47/JayE
MTDSEHRRIIRPPPTTLKGFVDLALEVEGVASVHAQEHPWESRVVIISFTENNEFKEQMPTSEKIAEVQAHVNEHGPFMIKVVVVGMDP